MGHICLIRTWKVFHQNKLKSFRQQPWRYGSDKIKRLLTDINYHGNKRTTSKLYGFIMPLNQSLEDSECSSQIVIVTLLDEWLFLAVSNLASFFKKCYIMTYTQISQGSSGRVYSDFVKTNTQHVHWKIYFHNSDSIVLLHERTYL